MVDVGAAAVQCGAVMVHSLRIWQSFDVIWLSGGSKLVPLCVALC